MRVFHCDHCGQLVFFENVECVQCGNPLAYLPDVRTMASLESAGDDVWKCPDPSTSKHTYRLCANYTDHNVCNWVVPADSEHELCDSCRLTQVIPDLDVPGHRLAWYKLEIAKRRLLVTLFELGLPVVSKEDDPEHGLSFEFLADMPDTPVLTGHDDGLITLNIAEADDVERTRRRKEMGEPYRTLLGHMRHEVGHYYWDRLVRDGNRLEPFRRVFGDERADYAAALKQHYATGAPADWAERFVSEYATTHPWEDWAETWAHYLHMVDVLETAAECGLSVRPKRKDDPAMKPAASLRAGREATFGQLVESWFPLTYVLNNLNRGLGMPDAYPFVLSPAVQEKLRFVHETVS